MKKIVERKKYIYIKKKTDQKRSILTNSNIPHTHEKSLKKKKEENKYCIESKLGCQFS